ncbi:MAG: GatB/YqeY domain-containing protein [Chloroflexi bacterium]|nr:GatB/YqeY domain-containing protein [Chloroflexota bacterium]MCL5107966.1 GatB/YqeY domain-containing protein [Chloroflexota bacterium]
MGLQETLQGDLTEALRAGDKTRLTALRLVLATLKNAQIEKGRPLDEGEVVRVLQKEAKTHRESITEFAKGNRQDLVAKEEAELAVVESYLPSQIGREELVAAAQRVIDAVGASGPRDIGKVMPRLLAELQGRVDGRVASQVVQELLTRRQP